MTDHTPDNDFRHLIAARRGDHEPAVELVEAEEGADTPAAGGCFSLVSADRLRKVMLELRFKTGDCHALAYSYLLGVTFNPSAGITLDFGGVGVTITGRHLRPLFDALVSQRVAWVRELESQHASHSLQSAEVAVTEIAVSIPSV